MNNTELNNRINEYLDSNCLDMEESYSREQIFTICKDVIVRMKHYKSGVYYVDEDTHIKWLNTTPSWISFNSPEGTGVATCSVEMDSVKCFDDIIDMINESWYAMKYGE